MKALAPKPFSDTNAVRSTAALFPSFRSLPYFIPIWLVFAYIAFATAFHWPEHYVVALFFALTITVSQVPRFIHGVTLRQWFLTAGVVPIITTLLLTQALKLITRHH